MKTVSLLMHIRNRTCKFPLLRYLEFEQVTDASVKQNL